MLTFNGQNLLCVHEFAEAEAPHLHAQDTQFAGVSGVSRIVLGVAGRSISLRVWLTDGSLTSPAAVDAYRQQFDLLVGTTADLSISGQTSAYYGDCCFEGFAPSGPVLPAIGAGMPAGSYWQPGVLHFYQLSVP